jgi:hypothetical protein
MNACFGRTPCPNNLIGGKILRRATRKVYNRAGDTLRLCGNPACLSRLLSISAASVRTSGRRDNFPVFPIEAGKRGDAGSFSKPVALR